MLYAVRYADDYVYNEIYAIYDNKEDALNCIKTAKLPEDGFLYLQEVEVGNLSEEKVPMLF